MTDETTSEQLAEIEPQGDTIQVREGRWRTRHGWVRNVTPTPEGDGREQRFPWWDAQYRQTWTADGRYHFGGASALDLVEYLGPIEPDKTQELETKTQELPDKTQELPEYTPPEGWRVLAVGEVLQPGDQWVNWEGTVSRPDIQHGDGATVSGGRYIRHVETERNTAAIEELRSEVSYVQRLLGESNRKVAQLEELVTSLRAINEAQEKAFEAAGQHNSDLQSRLNAVCSEWGQQAETIRRLQIELDAAQQVPADSPELRQLRADLEQMTLGRDTYRDGYERVLSDLKTIRETTKAETVEAIVEWLEPVRATIEAADNVQQTMRADNLACDIIRNLPGILRYVVGLNHPEDIE